LHGDFLVGNKMDVNCFIAWLYFLWVTRWIILHGDFLVGNKMDVNCCIACDFLVGNKMDVNGMWFSCG